MSTAAHLTEIEQHAVGAVGSLMETTLGSTDPPEGEDGEARQGVYFMEPDNFE